MLLITLVPRSLKGKNRLHEAQLSVTQKVPLWDGVWQVAQTAETVSFNQNAGPWLFIYPHGALPRDMERHSRWVHKITDIDFEVVIKIETP